MFGVNGIPCLVFVDVKTGKLITDEGRSGVSTDSFVEDFPYHPKPVNDLSGSLSGINDKSSLVVLMESASQDVKDKLTAALLRIADEEFKKPDEEQAVKRIFTGKGGGPVKRIREMVKLPSE